VLTEAVSEPHSAWDHALLEDLKPELRSAASGGEVAAVLREVIEQISQPVEFWARAVDFVSIHIDVIGGRSPTSIAQLLALELLRHRKALRIPFFQTVADRLLVSAVDQILPELDLDADECLAIIARCAISGTSDPIVPFYSSGLIQWARSHAETAREAVEAWLSDEPRARNLPPRAFGAIAEGATKSTGGLEWRRDVLAKLGARSDEESWALAGFLACFAWQEPPPPPEERHIALQSQVKRCPRRLICAGIAAMHREAHEYPQEAFETILHILGLVDLRTLPSIEAFAIIMRAIGAFDAALEAARKQSLHIEAPERAVTFALPIPPIHSPQGLISPTDPLQRVDHLLYNLYHIHPRSVFDFLSQWMLWHSAHLVASQRDLAKIFPMLTHYAGLDVVGAWTVELLHADKPDLRHLAARLLAYSEAPNLPAKCLEALSEREVKVIAHEILATGHSMRSESLVQVLFYLLDSRPALYTFFAQLFVDEVAQMYPGACRDELERRRASHDPNVNPSIVASEQALHEHLRKRDDHLERRLAVPELRATSPAMFHYFLWQEQMQRELQRQGTKSSPLMRLAMHIVIARGEGSTTGTTSPSVIKFNRFQFSTELPGDAVIDRPGATLRRLDHWRQAAALLENDGDDQ
jgi:hypothetical protein